VLTCSSRCNSRNSLKTISQVMSRATQTRAGKSGRINAEITGIPGPARPLHILVAEDNEFNVILLKQLFAAGSQRPHRE